MIMLTEKQRKLLIQILEIHIEDRTEIIERIEDKTYKLIAGEHVLQLTKILKVVKNG